MIRARLLWSSGLLEQFDDFGMTRHCRRHGGGDIRSGFQADIRTAIKKGLHNFNLSSLVSCSPLCHGRGRQKDDKAGSLLGGLVAAGLRPLR